MGIISANFHSQQLIDETPTETNHGWNDLPGSSCCHFVVSNFLRFGLRTERRLSSLHRRKQGINRGFAERARPLRSFAQRSFY